MSALAKTEFNRAKIVAGGPITPNLVSGNYLGAGETNLYPLTASYEIALLVGKDKSALTCETGGTMPCCAKK